MAFLIQNTRTDDFIADVSGGWPDWTPVRSFAKRFSTKQEAEQFIAKNQVKGDDPYMKVVKEMKGLKEFVKTKKLTESWMPDSETISWLKDYLRDVKRGEGWVDIDKVIYDADIELNKDLEDHKEELADYIKKIGGASILKEDQNIKMHRDIDDVDVIIEPDGSYTFWKDGGKTKGAQNRSLKGQQGAVKELGALGYEVVKESASVDDRFYGGDYPTGEVNVYSDTGAFGISVHMGRYSVGTDTSNINWNVGYCAQGPYNSGSNKVKQVKEGDDVEKIVKKDLDEFKACLKRCIDYCDKEIASTLRKLGYK